MRALLAMGSIATGTADELSDVDLIFVVDDERFEEVLSRKLELVKTFGRCLNCFPGDHVGMPNLVLYLLEVPLMHADILFEKFAQASSRAHPIRVLWERDPSIRRLLKNERAFLSAPAPQWIEDRFWVWLHKGVSKVARGELFEGIEYTVHLRSKILGPMALDAHGENPLATKGIDLGMPEIADRLSKTVAPYDRYGCMIALKACGDFYRFIRQPEGPHLVYNTGAEHAVCRFLDRRLKMLCS